MKGGRLELHAHTQGVFGFDKVGKFPVWALFWRRANETRARRRLPIFDVSIGITIDSLMIDKLHALYLGPAQTWCFHVLWSLIKANAYTVGGGGGAPLPFGLGRHQAGLVGVVPPSGERLPRPGYTKV